MLIDLKNVFNNDGEKIKIDYQLDLDGFEYFGNHPFLKPVSVRGEIRNDVGVVSIDAIAEYEFNGLCDRCAERFVKTDSVILKHFLVPQLNDEENDEYLVVENAILDLDELVTEDISLSLPYRMLCSEDCKGLCSICGKNLNIGQCDCKKPIDPRMEVLLQLLENDEEGPNN